MTDLPDRPAAAPDEILGAPPGATPGSTPDPTLDLLADPALAAPFRSPPRVDVDSAWYGHVPFAQWLIPAIAPGLVVELGTHAGVSYTAFCESVRLARLPTRCIAVDTWQGDVHAGFYPEQIYSDLKAFHDARYADFSTMQRCRFDEALAYVADGSIDLLHVDGRHHYEDVVADYTSWIPKLSPRAVVLFHDTQVRERDFGVWRYWAELAPTRPSFEFLHGYGLGVLCHGAQVPPAAAKLCAADAAATATLRERFSRLGERWTVGDAHRHAGNRAGDAANRRDSAERRVRALEVQLAGARSAAGLADRAHVQAEAALAEARQALELQLGRTREALFATQLAEARLDKVQSAPEQLPWGRQMTDRLAAAELQREAADLQREAAERQREAAERQRDESRAETRIILGSTSWRLTAPLRALRGGAAPALPPTPPEPPEPPEPRHEPEPLPEPQTALAEPTPTPAPQVEDIPAPAVVARDKILFVSGEAHTPGHVYRSVRYAAAARALGHAAQTVSIEAVQDADLVGCRLVVLWRVQVSTHVETLCRLAREKGAAVAFDIDDLMVVPDFATAELIDGIRSTNSVESQVRDLFVRIRQTIDLVDFCLCTTEELAFWLRGEGQDTYVLPNTFDVAGWRAARRAVQARQPDGVLRLGYAGGTRTHQKDFARAAPAVARFLATHAEAVLVLFRDPASGEGLVLADEFAEIPAERIEWRDMVPLEQLPAELARFDINLVPLETGNVFVEAKSELKYFEAALAGVPTIASPTAPFVRAMRHGETGMFAADDAGWTHALETLTDPALRARLAHAAYLDALAHWGPERARSALRDMLSLRAGGAEAARAFQLSLLRRALPPAAPPAIPGHEVVFAHDRIAGADAEVTVVVPLYNYADYVLEALESVRLQDLDALDLIVVDDASTDGSLELAREWFAMHHGRFRRALLLRNRVNSKLGPTRNVGFDRAETRYVLPLDADNRLATTCCKRLLAALDESGAAFAHPLIRTFGDRREILGEKPYLPNRLVGANTIDAMALVAKSAWAAVGGYDDVRFGWEDYDLWCRFAERALWGVQVAEELADYRTHGASMLHAATEHDANRRALIADMERRHDWLRLTGKR